MCVPPCSAGSSPFEGLDDSGSRVVLATLSLHHRHQQPLAHGLERGGVSVQVPEVCVHVCVMDVANQAQPPTWRSS